MASLSDLLDRLNQANDTLTAIHDDLTSAIGATNQKIDKLDADVGAGFHALGTILAVVVNQQRVTNQILLHMSHQLDTSICSLEKISKNTCGILNEAHEQTLLERAIEEDVDVLRGIDERVHPGPALELQREHAMRAEIAACCEKSRPTPPCSYSPCDAPPPLEIDLPSPTPVPH